MPATAPPAISQGTRSWDFGPRAGGAAPASARPHPGQKRASAVNAVPHEGQYPGREEVTVEI